MRREFPCSSLSSSTPLVPAHRTHKSLIDCLHIELLECLLPKFPFLKKLIPPFSSPQTQPHQPALLQVPHFQRLPYSPTTSIRAKPCYQKRQVSLLLLTPHNAPSITKSTPLTSKSTKRPHPPYRRIPFHPFASAEIMKNPTTITRRIYPHFSVPPIVKPGTQTASCSLLI